MLSLAFAACAPNPTPLLSEPEEQAIAARKAEEEAVASRTLQEAPRLDEKAGEMINTYPERVYKQGYDKTSQAWYWHSSWSSADDSFVHADCDDREIEVYIPGHFERDLQFHRFAVGEAPVTTALWKKHCE